MISLSGRVRRLKADDGAQMLEFALVAPVVVFLLFGIIYALLAVAANVSLSHAASAAVRYASIPTDNIEPVYPSAEDVSARLFDSTPFFAPESCLSSVSGGAVPNTVVSVSVECPFPNPLGITLSRLSTLLAGDGGQSFGDTFTLSALATGRRE